MVAFSRSAASAHIQQILRTTAKHFSLHAPEPVLRLDRGEFIDPLPLRWKSAPGLLAHGSPASRRGIGFSRLTK